jgi:ribosomal protein S14
VFNAPVDRRVQVQQPPTPNDAPSPLNATAAVSPATPNYCEVCGQELGVNEKLRGLAAHEKCAPPTPEGNEVPIPEAIAVPPSYHLAETAQTATVASSAPESPPGPKVPGRCDLCGEELGVNEKLRGLAAHERCAEPAPVVIATSAASQSPEAQPVTIAPSARAPAQAAQVYCTECGTPMPASSRFCHKCGSAAIE